MHLQASGYVSLCLLAQAAEPHIGCGSDIHVRDATECYWLVAPRTFDRRCIYANPTTNLAEPRSCICTRRVVSRRREVFLAADLFNQCRAHNEWLFSRSGAESDASVRVIAYTSPEALSMGRR